MCVNLKVLMIKQLSSVPPALPRLGCSEKLSKRRYFVNVEKKRSPDSAVVHSAGSCCRGEGGPNKLANFGNKN